jgi:septation ring formation regulator EzrA
MDKEFRKQFSQLVIDVSSIKLICTETNEKLEAVTNEVTQLKKEARENREVVNRMRVIIQKMGRKIDELEQYSRKINVIITGIPEKQDENLKVVVKKLAEKLEITLQDYDICAIHRLPSKTKGPTTLIIVRLNAYERKK